MSLTRMGGLLRYQEGKNRVYLQSCQFLWFVCLDVSGVAFLGESQTVEHTLHCLGSCFTISAGISGILCPRQYEAVSLAE